MVIQQPTVAAPHMLKRLSQSIPLQFIHILTCMSLLMPSSRLLLDMAVFTMYHQIMPFITIQATMYQYIPLPSIMISFSPTKSTSMSKRVVIRRLKRKNLAIGRNNQRRRSKTQM